METLKEITRELNSWNGALDYLEYYENDEEFYELVTDEALLDRLFEIFNKHMEEGIDDLLDLDGGESSES